MPKYIIKYYFDGYGEEEVEAKNKKEVEEMFFDGGLDMENEWGENYNIETIERKL